jgi:ABC-type polysaccharide/polyol phosphate export permease
MQFLQYGFLGAAPPGPAMISSNFLVIFLVTILGIRIFKKESKYFDDWV